MKKTILVAIACTICLDWTRLTGTVKGINLTTNSITIQNKDGDLLTVPVDYQVKVTEKGGEMRDLKHLNLDEKVTLTRTPQDKPPADDMTGMAQPEPAK